MAMMIRTNQKLDVNTKPQGLTAPLIEAYKVRLRPIEKRDLEQVRQWRNDPDVARNMFSQHDISQHEHAQWFTRASEDAQQWNFVFEFRAQPVGFINLKSLDEKRLVDSEIAEPGMYMGAEQYRGNILAFCPALALNDYCFENLSITTLRARVLRKNLAAIKFNQALGYQASDAQSDAQTLVMELNRAAYMKSSRAVKAMIR